MNTNYTYQLTQYTSILRSDGASIPPDPANRDYAEYLAWVAAGNTPTPVPQPTIQQIIVSLESAVQVYIDSIAQKKGYDSGVSCASYAASTNATFAADATAFIAWRDSVWVTCQQIENTDLAATPPIIPTAAVVIAALPAAPW